MKFVALSIIPFLLTTSQADLIWTVGLPGDGWPQDLGTGGGPETIFVQEAGTNDLPGAPDNPPENQQGDDDYYFAGVYNTVLDGGNYEPLGVVAENEVGAERAFAGSDNTLRYHFNFPGTIGATTPLSISWDANNLHGDGGADPRYGVEVYVNGVRVAEETIIRDEQLGEINTTAAFTLPDVNGTTGEGFDNYVELRGINYNAEGGGNWMGVDHVSLDAELSADGIVVDTDVALALTGAVQTFELLVSNASQTDPVTISQIDITGDSSSKFSIGTALPLTIAPETQQAVEYTFDPTGELGMVSASFVIVTEDADAENVSVALAGTIHDPMLASTTAIDFGESETAVSLPLSISNAGLSQDLVIESITFAGRGANAFSATNPGTIAAGTVGEATVTFTPPADPGIYSAILVINSNDPVSPMIDVMVTGTAPSDETLIWTVGLPGDGWPQDLGIGGGPETIFVQEAGTNELPGEPDNATEAQMSDDDYYFAGVYTTVLDGSDYEPVGPVAVNEEGAERAVAGIDNTLRYHFNLPTTIGLNTPLSVWWDANNLHGGQEDSRYGLEVYYNGILVAEETLIRTEQLGAINTTPTFTLDDVNGKTGEGFDNYVELRGINYNDAGGGNWMGIDHVSLVSLPDELFMISDIDRVDGDVSLTWLSKSGRYYAVDASPDLVTWEAIVTDYPDGGSTGETTSYTDAGVPMEVTNRYYRVRQVPTPALYSTDFENGADGWTASVDQGDTTWELGTPNADGITMANSGTQAWGTNIAGDYTPGASARLRSPLIDVSGDSPRLSLEFSYYNNTTNAEGTLINFLNENGDVIESLTDRIITGQTDGWQPFIVRVPDEALGGKIMVEFQFLSDEDDVVGAGTYIDDVLID
jgi:hypothetical protein